jgi:DNA-binding IclR family transcriptional regulator
VSAQRRQRDQAALQRRALRYLQGAPGPVPVTALARRLGVPRPALDRALSKLGPAVQWRRIGRGGDRLYTARVRP